MIRISPNFSSRPAWPSQSRNLGPGFSETTLTFNRAQPLLALHAVTGIPILRPKDKNSFVTVDVTGIVKLTTLSSVNCHLKGAAQRAAAKGECWAGRNGRGGPRK
jgi:hypothetical protein